MPKICLWGLSPGPDPAGRELSALPRTLYLVPPFQILGPCSQLSTLMLHLSGFSFV